MLSKEKGLGINEVGSGLIRDTKRGRRGTQFKVHGASDSQTAMSFLKSSKTTKFDSLPSFTDYFSVSIN